MSALRLGGWLAVMLACSAALIAAPETAAASGPVIPAYGQVGSFGGFDEPSEGIAYGATATSGTIKPGRFVYPIGMAVDTTDPSVPKKDGYAIYVLDLLNPQALNAVDGSRSSAEGLSLEYRIQKLGSSGEPLASREFTLASSESVAGLHATALAVDPATDQVYVLLADLPNTPGNAGAGAVASYAIESWTAGRKTGEEALSSASRKVIVGPTAFQPGATTTLVGDLHGESLAVDDVSGEETSLAVAGVKYGGVEGPPQNPVIQRVGTKEGAGAIKHATWGEPAQIKATEDAAAEHWAQKSSLIYALSANPDGSLNAVFGPAETGVVAADEEPNMATISAGLEQTTAVLPWASAAEEGSTSLNRDRSATTYFHQEIEPAEYRRIAPRGADRAGTLAPSVVRLASQGPGTSEVYAGVVAQTPMGVEGLDPQSNEPPSWPLATNARSESNEAEVVSVKAANLAVRLFDPQGESLGMIGNVTPGGTCSLQGGPYGENGDQHGSFVALAAGKEGTLFALVQPDLDGNESPFEVSPGSPMAKTVSQNPLTQVQGDKILEFAPGAGTPCPQPSGGFSITNMSVKGSKASTGSEPVTVAVGSTLKLESEATLQGAAPWSYEWQSGEGATTTNKWLAVTEWKWPSPSVEFTYAKEGTYTSKLSLVSDFGSLSAQRTVNVIKGGALTACFEGPHEATVNQTVAFNAKCTKAPASITAYKWKFGDGHGETTTKPEASHQYSTASNESVTLTVTDALGQEESATNPITIVAAKTTTIPTTTTTTTPPPPPSSPPPVQVINTSPTEVNPKIASTASVHGTVAIKVSCPAGKASCSGTITLRASAAKTASAHHKTPPPLVLGKASFSLPGGQSTTVQLHLTSKGIALLRAKHSLKVVAVITATDPGGHAKTVQETITLRAAQQKSKKKR